MVSFWIVDSMRDCEEEVIVRVADEANEASATAKPMPEVAPKMRTCLPASLLYLVTDSLARIG